MIKPTRTQDSTVNRAVEDIRREFNRAQSRNLMADGVLASGPDGEEVIEFSAGTTRVNHKLGRKPKGWLMLNPDAAVTLYSTGDTEDPRSTLELVASATVRTRIWVF